MPMSAAALTSLLSRESDDAVIYLATLTHPELETVRLARNVTGVNITSRGQVFTAVPFDLQLPQDDEEAPRMRFVFPNVDRAIGQALLQVNTPISVAVEVLLDSNLDEVLLRFARFEMQNISFDSISVQGELTQLALASEPFGIRVTPNRFPALFR